MDQTGDANTYLQSMFTSRQASPFGTSYKSMHEVGFNKRELSALTQPPADGHPSRMEFKVSSTLGHLVHQMWLKAKFTVELKDAATLGAYFGASTSGVALQKKLENIKLHPDMILGMMDNVEMRHNSIVFQRLKRDNMRAMRREQYTKEDHERQTRLLNGGIPKYHPLEGNHSALAKGKARRLTTTQTTGSGGFSLLHKPHTYHGTHDGMTDKGTGAGTGKAGHTTCCLVGAGTVKG